MAVTQLSSKGQVVIPADIRRRLHLDRSSVLNVEVRGNEIVLTPLDTDAWRSLANSLDGPSLTRDLEDERRRERDR